MDNIKDTDPLFDEEEIDLDLINTQGKFFKNIFNKEFISNSYYILSQKNEDLNSRSKDVLRDDPIFKILRDLHQLDPEGIYLNNYFNFLAQHIVLGPKNDKVREEEEKKYKNTEAKDAEVTSNKSAIQISMNPAEFTQEKVDFEYTKKMDALLVDKFKEFGVFKDYETLIRSANRFYERDEISKYHKLLVNDETKKLKDIIFGKKDEIFIKKFNLEAAIISEVDREIDKKIEV